MQPERPRLYLVAPRLRGAAILDAIEGADVASVLLSDDSPDFPSLAQALQQAGVAVLLEGGAPRRVIDSGADGMHLGAYDEAFAAAIKTLSPDYIVGVGGLETKDEAMRAGEQGADYVLFGDVGEGETALERVAWWSEMFTTPCVGLAHRLDEVEALARAGADFVMLTQTLLEDERGAKTVVAEAMRRLSGET